MGLLIYPDREPQRLSWEPRVGLEIRGERRRDAVALVLLRHRASFVVESTAPNTFLFRVAAMSFDVVWRAWDETRDLEAMASPDNAGPD
jgi:hypothetical protein